MKSLKTTSSQSLATAALLTVTLAIGGLLAVSPTSATASRAELTTSLEVSESLVSRLARGPVPAAEAFRQITIQVGNGDGQMMVLLAALLRDGRVVEAQESRPFRFQPGIPVFDVPLFSDGWERNGFLPGEQALFGNQFLPDVQFRKGAPLPGGAFLVDPDIKLAFSGIERAAGVSLRGSDTLVLAVLPAVQDARASAQFRPLFIAGIRLGTGAGTP